MEPDTWLTKDGCVILSHDDDIEESEQFAQSEPGRKLTLSKYEGRIDQLTFAGTPYHYITLDQLFDATAERYPHLMYRVEIKDYQAKNIAAVTEIIERYGLRHRCQIICFNDEITTVARKRGYAVHYLSDPGSFSGATNLPDAARRLESIYRPLNSWYSSRWENIDTNAMDYMQHFGLSIQPWPTSTENDLHGHFIEGYNGIITDYCHWASDYVKYVEASLDDQGELQALCYLYDGNVKDMSARPNRWSSPAEPSPPECGSPCPRTTRRTGTTCMLRRSRRK